MESVYDINVILDGFSDFLEETLSDENFGRDFYNG